MKLKTPLIAFASTAAALGSFAIGGTTSAFASGAANKAVAQVEISGNCDNPNFWFCSQVVGTGGIWTWSALDNVTSTAVPGWNTMDATIADCGHTQGGGGAGGHGGPDNMGVWQEFPSLGAAEEATQGNAAPLLIPLGDPGAYSGAVYVLDFFPGSGGDDFEAVVPAQQGHYSGHPAPGVSLNIQVAP